MTSKSKTWRWVLGLTYIVAVAAIWIAASFVVQSVVDAGVSPFLITYICNSLFVVYIPLVEIGRYLEDNYGGLWPWGSNDTDPSKELGESEKTILLGESDQTAKLEASVHIEEGQVRQHGSVISSEIIHEFDRSLSYQNEINEDADKQVDKKGRWTRTRMAKVSLLISPFWFLAQLTFNLSLKYTTVTVSISLSFVLNILLLNYYFFFAFLFLIIWVCNWLLVHVVCSQTPS